MRIAKLDHLRALAAILVLLDHFTSGVKRNGSFPHDAIVSFFRSGHLGVSLFLVLSGYVLTQSALKNREVFTYSNFIKRRLYRIFPALIVLFILVITATRATSTPMDIIRLITLQFNTGNELSGWGNDVLPVGVMWTASVELQIYLLFPLLLALALRPRGLRFLIEVCAFVLILRFIFLASLDSGWSDLYHTILGRLDQFVLGMILALFMSHKFSESRLKSWSLFLFALLSFLLLGQFRGIYRDFYTSTIGGSASFLVEGLIFAAIIYTYQSPSISIPKKISDALAWIGERSYSVYLFHLLVGRVIVGYLDQLGLWNGASLTRAFLVTIFVVLPGVLLFSALSYRIVEKPFIELGKLKKFSLLSYSKS